MYGRQLGPNEVLKLLQIAKREISDSCRAFFYMALVVCEWLKMQERSDLDGDWVWT